MARLVANSPPVTWLKSALREDEKIGQEGKNFLC